MEGTRAAPETLPDTAQAWLSEGGLALPGPRSEWGCLQWGSPTVGSEGVRAQPASAAS